MEYLVFLVVIVAFILFLFIRESLRTRKEEKRFIQFLYEQYGTLPNREMKPERFARVNSYYERHKKEGQLDDITWNDLNMDDVFHKMNYCYSATGEEYLYYTLRNTMNSPEELEHLEECIIFFQEHPDERVRVQLLMNKMGFTGKYSIYDYLDHLDFLGKRSNRMAILRDLLFIPLVAMLFVKTSVAIMGIIILMIYNIMVYLKEKKIIEPYIISIAYVLRLIQTCEGINTLNLPCLQSEQDNMKKILPEFREMKFSLGIVMWQNSGNPLDALLDYVRMTFHFDIILFNRLFHMVQKHVSDIDTLIGFMGYVETTIAIGALRHSMSDGYSVPVLSDTHTKDAAKKVLTMENGYHLFLQRPVKNSITADKGVLLTGSNASGKSTFLRTVALNAVLAQTVHTCAADSYTAPLYRIYSSMSLKDDMEHGESYYMVEIKSLKRILDVAGNGDMPVLCFVDEVLRGTNTVERIAASTQILKSLTGNYITCFAATHDIELTTLLEKEYHNYHFEEDVKDGDVLFDYRLLPGRATTRNAIKLLEIMGYEQQIIREATGLAAHFIQEGKWN